MAKDQTRVKAGSAQAKRLEERIQFVQEYIKLWRQFFEKFSDGFEGRKILKKDEEEFSRILNSLAHHHYRFSQMAYPQMRNTESIIKMLCNVISLSHLKNLSEAQLSKILIDWHSLFIDMNKALGRLISKRPLTPEEEQLAKSGAPPPQQPVARPSASE